METLASDSDSFNCPTCTKEHDLPSNMIPSEKYYITCDFCNFRTLIKKRTSGEIILYDADSRKFESDINNIIWELRGQIDDIDEAIDLIDYPPDKDEEYDPDDYAHLEKYLKFDKETLLQMKAEVDEELDLQYDLRDDQEDKFQERQEEWTEKYNDRY